MSDDSKEHRFGRGLSAVFVIMTTVVVGIGAYSLGYRDGQSIGYRKGMSVAIKEYQAAHSEMARQLEDERARNDRASDEKK
jgi:hypothetical protein